MNDEVDLALIQSEALYCLRREQLVSLCRRRGIKPGGRSSHMADLLRESIEAKQPKKGLPTAEHMSYTPSSRIGATFSFVPPPPNPSHFEAQSKIKGPALTTYHDQHTSPNISPNPNKRICIQRPHPNASCASSTPSTTHADFPSETGSTYSRTTLQSTEVCMEARGGYSRPMTPFQHSFSPKQSMDDSVPTPTMHEPVPPISPPLTARTPKRAICQHEDNNNDATSAYESDENDDCANNASQDALELLIDAVYEPEHPNANSNETPVDERINSIPLSTQRSSSSTPPTPTLVRLGQEKCSDTFTPAASTVHSTVSTQESDGIRASYPTQPRSPAAASSETSVRQRHSACVGSSSASGETEWFTPDLPVGTDLEQQYHESVSDSDKRRPYVDMHDGRQMHRQRLSKMSMGKMARRMRSFLESSPATTRESLPNRSDKDPKSSKHTKPQLDPDYYGVADANMLRQALYSSTKMPTSTVPVIATLPKPKDENEPPCSAVRARSLRTTRKLNVTSGANPAVAATNTSPEKLSAIRSGRLLR